MRAGVQERGYLRGHEHVRVPRQLPRQVLRVREEALPLLPAPTHELR